MIYKLRYTKKKITPYDSAESKTESSFSGIPEIRPEQRSCKQTLDDSPDWSDFCDFKKKFKYNDFVLAGDIGGTNTNLCIAGAGKKPDLLFSMHFKSSELESLIPAVKEMLKYAKEKHGIKVRNGCFAVAGPVSDGYARTTNIKWDVNAEDILRKTGLKRAILINDFQAIGYGISFIGKKDLFVVRKGKSKGNKAIIGAGTGLGKSVLIFDGKAYKPVASEGGHADFPAQSKFELKLVEFIRKKRNIKQVNYEELVSGRGIEIIYKFLSNKKDNAEHIAKSSKETMNLFIKFYARCAKNFVLESLATGGLYIAGGIAAKNKKLFKSKEFLKEFENTSKLSAVLKKVPIYVITNYDVGLIGASFIAINMP